jgi:hypothetical protein
MSESTSSPSVNVHPVSPSSSLSTDSAPRSEPTSDEQPDLGFNELLREYSHLQPHPRIPIQIRSATSSTTPTYHAESVTGSDFRIRSGRGNSRGTPSALSTLSTFTRPPTSSLQPDGSTVWAHPLIASYLPRSTPSNDPEEEEYSPSESASRASTALTVEIRDVRSFDGESRDLDPDTFSPEPSSAIPIQVESENQRLDSLETPLTEDDIDSLSSHNQIGDSSMTSRGILRRTITSSSQEQSDNSITSMQLQSQVIPASTIISTSSLSFTSSDDAGMSISIAGPSASSSINSRMDSTIGAPTSSESTSTVMNVFLNPSALTDSSYQTTRTTSSAFSLMSYQFPDSPSVADVHREDSESEMVSGRRPLHSNGSLSMSSATSSSIAMLTQQTLGSSSSRSTTLTERPFTSQSNFSIPATESPLQNPHSLLAASPLTNPHSLNAASPLLNPHSLPATSPLPNPFSSAATPETDLRLPMINDQFMPTMGSAVQLDHAREVTVVNDLDTPDHPLSAILFEPPLRIFEPIHDDEDEAGNRFSNQHSSSYAFINSTLYEALTKRCHSAHLQTISGTQPTDSLTYETNHSRQSTGESYRPGGRTPRYLSARTPKGIPTVSTRSEATGDSQPTSSEAHSLEQRPEASDTLRSSAESSYAPHFPSENGIFVPPGPVAASRTETITTTIQSNTESVPLRSQGTVVDLRSSSMGVEEEHPLSSLTTYSQEQHRTQAYPSSVGLHLLPSEPLLALGVHPSSSSSLLRKNNSLRSQTQLPAEVGHGADPEAEQLGEEATTSQTRFLPSLGYLDEALSFIASERARLTAARTSSGGLTGGPPTSDEQLGRESEGGDHGLRQQEGEDWRDAIGKSPLNLHQ